MKRHIQKTGVRRFHGEDMIELQAEPLRALDAFFAEYGACIIEGCAIAAADGGTFDVSPGLVALECADPESGAVAVRTMAFEGARGVAMPLYLTARWQAIERVYDDGKVKPIAYNLTAAASGVAPEAPHLTLTAAGGERFVDVLQDPAHRFLTDVERLRWNDILRQAKEYAGLQAEAAVRSAKEYADRVVAALVDNSPDLLNTLEELAKALGNDPNFATTVMTAIGERVKTSDFTVHTKSTAHVTANERNAWNAKVDSSALNAKADKNHGHTMAGVSDAAAWWGEQLRAVEIGGVNLQVNGAFDHGSDGINGYNLVFAGIRANQYNEAFPLYGSSLLAIDWKINADSYVHIRENIYATKVRPNTTYTISWWEFDGGAIESVCAMIYMNDVPLDTRTFTAHYGWHRNVMTVTTKNNTNRMFLRLGAVVSDTSWSAVDGLKIEEGSVATAWGPSPYDIDTPKLDALPAKIIRGSVNAFGQPAGGSGFGAYASGNMVRIDHKLGTGYCVTGNVHSSSEKGLQLEVVEKGNNTTLVGVRGLGGNYLKIPFDFMLSSY